MKFTVIALRAAERDFDEKLKYLSARSKAGAEAWARAFDKALARLEENADSCPLAAGNEHIDFEVREVLFTTRRGWSIEFFSRFAGAPSLFCTSVELDKILCKQRNFANRIEARAESGWSSTLKLIKATIRGYRSLNSLYATQDD